VYIDKVTGSEKSGLSVSEFDSLTAVCAGPVVGAVAEGAAVLQPATNPMMVVAQKSIAIFFLIDFFMLIIFPLSFLLKKSAVTALSILCVIKNTITGSASLCHYHNCQAPKKQFANRLILVIWSGIGDFQ
jgi:hypothetical protein